MDEHERGEPRPMTPLLAVGWTFGVLFLFVLLLSLTARFRQRDDFDLVNDFGCQVVAYLLGLFAILRVHAPDASIRRFIGLRSTHALFYPLGVLMGVTLFAFADGLFDLITRRFPIGDEGKMSELIAQASTPKRALFFAILVVLGPVLEEVFFRGALVGAMRKATPPAVIVLVTGTAFAVVHLEWQRFVPIGIVGLAMCVVRLASGSIVPSVLLHTCFNASMFALILRSQVRGEEPGLAVPLLVLGAVGTAVLFALLRVIARTRDATIARAEDDLA